MAIRIFVSQAIRLLLLHIARLVFCSKDDAGTMCAAVRGERLKGFFRTVIVLLDQGKRPLSGQSWVKPSGPARGRPAIR